MSPQLVLATRNHKKLIELQQLLAPYGLSAKSSADFPDLREVVEDCDSFFAHAEKKARETALALNCWALGEDSGLSVVALKGAPGVDSAIYAGEPRDDERNNDKLLATLGALPSEKRDAFYISTVALADPQGEIVARAEGRCWGRIIFERRGTHGFGYDPLFEIVEYHKTFGELGPVVKHRLSHRGRAMRLMIPEIVKHLS